MTGPRPGTRARRDAILAVVRDRGPVGCREIARVVGQPYEMTLRDLNALYRGDEVAKIDHGRGNRAGTGNTEIGWYLPGADPDANDLEAILTRAAGDEDEGVTPPS